MFAYCMNNPVTNSDDGGEWAHIAFGAAIGAATSIAMGYLSAVQNGDSYTRKDILIDGVSGAISGGLAASGVGRLGQTLANGFISGVNTISKSIANNTELKSGEVFVSVCSGMLSGFIGGDGLTHNANAAKHMKTLISKPKWTQAYAKSFNKMSRDIGLAQSRFMGGAFMTSYINSAFHDFGYKYFE